MRTDMIGQHTKLIFRGSTVTFFNERVKKNSTANKKSKSRAYMDACDENKKRAKRSMPFRGICINIEKAVLFYTSTHKLTVITSLIGAFWYGSKK